jgi:hypothetical protein
MTTQADLDAQQKAWDDAHAEMDAKDIKTAGVADTLKSIGNKILGKGSSSKNDATGNERAYRMHVEERKGMGEAPMSRDEFNQSGGAGSAKA